MAFFLFSIWVDMDQRQRIIACAREFLGVRFRHQGRSRAGLDCLGLLLLTAERAGILFEAGEAGKIDVPTYSMRPDTALLQTRMRELLLPLDIAAASIADIVLLRIQNAPQHLAILSDYPAGGELGMIHAYLPAGGVVEHRYDAHWRAATHSAYRLR